MRTLRILVLSDGRPGHFNLSKGVIRALQYHYTIEPTWLDIRLRTGLGRAVMQRLLNSPRARLTTDRLRWFYEFAADLPPPPDLILSAGGNTLYANAWLARSFGCRNLFIGKIRQLTPACFWRVLTVLPAEPQPPFLYWPVAPVPVVPEELIVRAAAFRSATGLGQQSLWTLLVGGNGGGFRYRSADWTDLISMVRHLGQRHQIRWLIITSRRTGMVAEQLLASSLPPNLVASLSTYARDGGKHYFDFLATGEQLFLTEDSHSMLLEAIYTGKPVISVRPQEARPHGVHQLFLDRFAAEGLIQRFPIADLARGENPLTSAARAAPIPSLEQLGAVLRNHLDAS